ncbi:lanthionine synthetase C family protein [Amycolatopsis acidicola]|uniref:Lanthionine synthetase C family protein n=1 Tax=Amycolatopsis acidicola TaxID=2596893 RepID=A0A5N0VA02_9PSEU|nr:lanthionine synthetase C family protein [Amycolatopsis acidicola]KAA9163217.1 lanthionine synthetase C family protein [Amycolatopsis acidicola]
MSPIHDDHWHQSLAVGAVGIALEHTAKARTDPDGWLRAHCWIREMTRKPITAAPATATLFLGAPAIAYTLHTTGHPGYLPAVRVLDDHISALTQDRLARAHRRIDQRHLPEPREFDLISGLTGLGAGLLQRGHTRLLRDVLTYLVRLTQPMRHRGDLFPGWWCRSGPQGQRTGRWQGGHGNLGIAHGIAGPLALLALAHRRHVTVPGQIAAIRTILDWLDDWRRDTEHPWWPATLTRAEWRTGTLRQHGPQRPSWCYGTPGLVRAQQLAALALHDPVRQRRVEHVLADCIHDPAQLSQLRDATLCHGWAGLIHTTARVAADAAPDSPLTTVLPALRRRFATYLRQHPSPSAPGLLEGRAGIALAQHNNSLITRWDACLLLTT